MNHLLSKIFFLLLLFQCIQPALKAQNLDAATADKIAALPAKCIFLQYPNKLSQTIIDSTELLQPKVLHPAFYGCFDWHSSVHGHWSLVYLINHANIANKDSLIALLAKNINAQNIRTEISYFEKPHEKSYERTYGWAWLLKLQQALDESKDARLVQMSSDLLPLSHLIVQRYIEFLPKLLYPQRVGTHTNTAFGLSFAYDYAIHSKNDSLRYAIATAAKRYFLKDKNCPLNWEPSGTDFLSPCLEEALIMQKVLPTKTFKIWLRKFMPQLFSKSFQLEAAKVADRADGHLVHLDGLNFSRAWCLWQIAKSNPTELSHLKSIAEQAFRHSFHKIFDGNYEGEHWLPSFALHALEVK